ncbi:protein MIX23 [Diprion similis]|uniref:protein MIX23 n=1 Tax=Diprion similis TaxID=362088 RepID=UPI001EF93A5D|nr:protein MIX23 [Diprion similis]
MAGNIDCGDFLEFQDNLKKMRLLDDKIIYTLNTTIPTDSFKGQVNATATCKDLFQQIQTGHAQRETAIQTCINAAKERVKSLKEQRDSGKNEPELLKSLRKEQNKLRLLQTELNVEDVVRQQTTRVYSERCRSFYKPPSRAW